MDKTEIIVGSLIGILIILFVWLGVVFCKDLDKYQKYCNAKGGIVLSTDDKYVCIKRDNFL